MRTDIESMQVCPLENQCQAEHGARYELCRPLDDAPHRCILDTNGVHARDERSQPVREIDDIRPRDTGEEILGPAGEACYLVRKYRPADHQLVVLKDQTVERNRHLVNQQVTGQACRFLARYHTDGLEHFCLRPVMIEYPHPGKTFRSYSRRNPYQALNRLLGQRRMRSQGNQVIESLYALPKLLVEEAKEQRYRSGARAIWDNDQYSLPVQWQMIASLRNELPYILNCECLYR